jgi:hypothetical protein
MEFAADPDMNALDIQPAARSSIVMVIDTGVAHTNATCPGQRLPTISLYPALGPLTCHGRAALGAASQFVALDYLGQQYAIDFSGPHVSGIGQLSTTTPAGRSGVRVADAGEVIDATDQIFRSPNEATDDTGGAGPARADNSARSQHERRSG